MKLSKIMRGVPHELIAGEDSIEIEQICSDSRSVGKGDLFVALRGLVTDGHRFIDQALDRGAAAVICETVPDEYRPGIAYIRVEHTDVILGDVAANLYDHPSDKLRLVGVTGTNGKTTIATLLYELFRKLGYRVGLISTVCVRIDDETTPSHLTTPDALTLQRYLHEMVEAGCSYAFMEVSSIAIHQHRIGGTTFAGGIFTNLTRDHLDYHKTFANYLRAKQIFFDELPTEAFALTNLDETNGMVMVQNTRAQVHTYALKRSADYKGRLLEEHLDGTDLIIDGEEISVRLVGAFNAYNLLAVYGTARLLGAPKEETLRQISTLTAVTGRFQTLASKRGYYAVVDFAHTPDALDNVLTTLTDLQRVHHGRVITVVGAGGHRDKGKRPIMAATAAKYSDLLILTSDNPRDEDPRQILDDLCEGLSREQLSSTLRLVDRREAIRTACTMAEPGDIILIAGKGHETYQEINGVRHHFSDVEEVHRVFEDEERRSE